MKYTTILFSLIILVNSCDKSRDNSHDGSVKDFTQFVNPFIGTSRMGHTFPGATAPFGMVQLSPQTDFQVMYDEEGNYNTRTYEYCAGYQYSDSTILGFAHTNFSGTGHSDLGDILVMPTTGELILQPLPVTGNIIPDPLPGTNNKGFLSSFSHESEQASPGYYKVSLDDYNITAELTASERVGFHSYTFPETDDAHIILDMVYNVYHHDNKNVWTFLRVENDSLVTGYRQTKGWARTRKVFFAMQFSKAFSSYGHKVYDEISYDGFYRRFDQKENFPEMAGKNLRAYFNFDTEKDEKLLIKVALSSVSTAGALRNLEAEIPHWDFEKTMNDTRAKWNKELSVIDAEMMNDADMETFYTALYHSMLTPIVYEDIDGSYRGLDQNIHISDNFTNYSIFSLWDTYRALHPLFNIISPDRNNDMIKSMLAHYDQSVHGMLPVWSHYANENWCMIGYHAVSVIADALAKDVGDFDRQKALEACLSTANVEYFDGLGEYIKYGWFPEDLTHSSVSKTLEIAYNDWCIARIAESLNNTEALKEYTDRSYYYRNVYDESTGFMRPRLSSGKFKEEFDPLDTHGQGFIEGNAWNYGLYVPHQVEEMIDMMGGKESFTGHLDSLFTMKLDDKYIEQTEDITRDGIIGNYVHGNEPGHHIAYLYNYTGYPYKTQERVRMILNSMYGPGVDGLCGNDDAGQMSAWYILSSLGFYPLTPGSEYYDLGSPIVKRAVLRLSNRSTVTIKAENQAPGNIYVDEVLIDGKRTGGTKISHSELINAKEIVFKMTDITARDKHQGE